MRERNGPASLRTDRVSGAQLRAFPLIPWWSGEFHCAAQSHAIPDFRPAGASYLIFHLSLNPDLVTLKNFDGSLGQQAFHLELTLSEIGCKASNDRPENRHRQERQAPTILVVREECRREAY